MTNPALDGSLPSTIPVVDLDQPIDACRLANSLSEIGAFHVVIGSVERAAVDAAELAARTFFELPETVKLRSRQPDWRVFAGYYPEGTEGREIDDVWVGDDPKSSFCVDAPERRRDDLWPEVTGFRAALLDYYEVMGALSQRIRQLIAHVVQGSKTSFEDAFAAPADMLKLNWYPSLDGRSRHRFRAAGHTDFQFFTVLWQELGSSGLQVETTRRTWIDVPPGEGSMVVLIGDLLEIWSGGAVRACPHRVVAHRSSSRRPRSSVAFFHQPTSDALLPDTSGTTPLVTAGDYLTDRLIKG